MANGDPWRYRLKNEDDAQERRSRMCSSVTPELRFGAAGIARRPEGAGPIGGEEDGDEERKDSVKIGRGETLGRARRADACLVRKCRPEMIDMPGPTLSRVGWQAERGLIALGLRLHPTLDRVGSPGALSPITLLHIPPIFPTHLRIAS